MGTVDFIKKEKIGSNAFVFDIKEKTPVLMNIIKVAEKFGRGRNKTSEIVNFLVKKDLITKAESGIEGNNVKAYSLFANPHYAHQFKCLWTDDKIQ